MPSLENSSDTISYNRQREGVQESIAVRMNDFFINGNYYLLKHQLQNAETIYAELLRRGFDDFKLIHNVGVLYFLQGKREAALSVFSGGRARPAEQALFLQNIGAMSFRAGDYAEARTWFTKAIAIDPRLPEAHYHLALTLEQQGDSAAARPHFEQATALASVRPAADLVGIDGTIKILGHRAKDLKAPLKVVVGGHWSDHPGWLLIDQTDQDLCSRLIFGNNTIDFMFSEHVFEHLEFRHGVHFVTESFRTLKPGGVLRIVCPMIEQLVSFEYGSPDQNMSFFKNDIEPFFQSDVKAVESFARNQSPEFFRMFLMNTAFLRSDHKFIWSAKVLVELLKSLGFSQAAIRNVGEGSQPDSCLERRQRGIYRGYDWREDRQGPTYNADTMIVEAIK